MKKVIKKTWLDLICIIVGVISFSLIKISYRTSMILSFIFAILYIFNLFHNLYNRKYFTNFLCNLFLVGNVFILNNSIDALFNGVEIYKNIAYSYLLIAIITGNAIDYYFQNHNIKIKPIEFNLLTKNNKYLMLINLVDVFLVILYVLEANLAQKSVLFLYVILLILLIPVIYYFKRKHYVCAGVLTVDVLINYIVLIYFTVLSFNRVSDSINYLLMVPLYGLIFIPISILPIIFIKYKKEYITI